MLDLHRLYRCGCSTGCGQRRRLDAGNRDAPPLGAQGIGGPDHSVRTIAAGITVCDGLDPLLKIAADLQAELTQVGVGRATRLGQSGIEQLLTGPGGVTKCAQPDHAGTALEGVKGTAQVAQRQRIVMARLQLAQRSAGTLQHLDRFVEKHLAHFRVVF